MAWGAAWYFLLDFQLPDAYHRPRAFEESGRVYERLGVLLFRKLVRRGPIHAMAPSLRYSGRRDSLSALEHETRTTEAAHVLAFLVALSLPAYAAYRGWPDAAAWLLLFNVLMNVYPVILQRYNRVRLEQLLRKWPPNQPLQQTGAAFTGVL